MTRSKTIERRFNLVKHMTSLIYETKDERIIFRWENALQLDGDLETSFNYIEEWLDFIEDDDLFEDCIATFECLYFK